MRRCGSLVKVYLSEIYNIMDTIIDKYLKVKKIIASCKTLDHTKVAKQTIENLSIICLGVALPYEFYIVYINNLKFFLKLKIDELTKI
jgi:hypothetical protein